MMNDKKRKKVVILIYPETKLSGIFTKMNEDSRKRKKKNESCTESAVCNSCSCLIQSRRVFVSTNHGTSFSTFVVYNIEDSPIHYLLQLFLAYFRLFWTLQPLFVSTTEHTEHLQ